MHSDELPCSQPLVPGLTEISFLFPEIKQQENQTRPFNSPTPHYYSCLEKSRSRERKGLLERKLAH